MTMMITKPFNRVLLGAGCPPSSGGQDFNVSWDANRVAAKSVVRFGYGSDQVQLRFSGQPTTAGQTATLFSLFPEALPSQINSIITGFAGGKNVLLNGKLENWTRPTVPVESIVKLRQPDGSLKPIVLGELPWMSESDGQKAVAQAEQAWAQGNGVWPQISLKNRAELIEQFADKMAASRDVLATLLMLEIGKTQKDAYTEVDRTVDYIKQTATLAKALDQKSQETRLEDNELVKETRKPCGVTLCMGPSNYPINETFTTLIPALVMGNPIICKLPKIGALSMTPLIKTFGEVFPPGVISFISGDGETVVSPVISAKDSQTGLPLIASLAFIGGQNGARKIASQHPNRIMLNEVLGLGAKNPGIILPGATLTPALLKEIVSGALSFNGQRCTALKMLWVPKSRADEIAQAIAKQVDSLKLGMPFEAGTDITPVPESSIGYYQSLVNDAKQKGAKIINADGGSVSGTLFKPAVLYPVDASMNIYRQEQFGPVVPIAVYDDTPDANSKLPKGYGDILRYVASLEEGQQASIFGDDPESIQALVIGLANQTCRVRLNGQSKRGPDRLDFDGRKASAKGTLSLSKALDAFSYPFLLSAGSSEANQALIENTNIS